MSVRAASSSVITLPKGGGALRGIGEKFSPDPYTGTGNFTIPLAISPGRNGFQPQLNLAYSTGNGNGPFGLGWSLGVPGIARKTSKGIPKYNDRGDVFILSGAEDLVPMDEPGAATRHRPRTEGLFARILHHRSAGDDHWEVRSKDGLISRYGTPAMQDADPAVISDPADVSRIFAWKLTSTRDAFGNLIEYEYERDAHDDDARRWAQTYLRRIRYGDYDANGQRSFAVTVSFDYGNSDRPDPFSDYRSGFEIRTRRRCSGIHVHTETDELRLVRSYDLVYLDQAPDSSSRLPLNGVSLLSSIRVTGHDGNRTESLPALEFDYSRFEPERRDFFALPGLNLPSGSLANPDLELLDLFGSGLPDIVEMNGAVRYWRNLGNGRFDLPRFMRDIPAGLALADAGVQFIDANGDGRTDLMVTTGLLEGYYPLGFEGQWDRRGFQRFRQAPSFSLEDPEVRLVDLTGDGVTDAIRSGSWLECFFHDPGEGWSKPLRVERPSADGFPGSFSDPRVKWADMSGDGMQDIVLIHDGNVEYWPNLGHGHWGGRVSMLNNPRYPYGHDPRRILVGDVDGDGLADIVYVDDRRVTLWINQSGNRWSDPVTILGTPPVSDMDAVRLVDLLGSGISGLLWTRDANGPADERWFFLDFAGGLKPYLLRETDNHMGATTRVEYAPSTRFYLDDQRRRETRWQTSLPFPVQVVSRVEVIDHFSRGKLTTEYRYHHGHWDGAEHEFRGFGMVEQIDSEAFGTYAEAGLHGVEAAFADVAGHHFSPPTLARNWFHLGPVGAEFGDWKELDWSAQYWPGDPLLLGHTDAVRRFLQARPATADGRRFRRDALRTLRGHLLRTERYALDGSNRADRPYTVTESGYGLREVEPLAPGDGSRPAVFFPFPTVQRTTRWERGDDPMSQYSFTDDHDDFGQPRQQTTVAMPRRSLRRDDADGIRPLATHSRTAFAVPDGDSYIHDRPAHVRLFELQPPPAMTETAPHDLGRMLRDQAATASAIHDRFRVVLGEWQAGTPLPGGLRLLTHGVNYYDGAGFVGRAAGELGPFGALTRSESLIFTDADLDIAYGAQRPAYLDGAATLPPEAPAGFPGNTGYRRRPDSIDGHHAGYYADTARQRFDFQSGAIDPRGLVLATRDAVGNETTITPDAYRLLPVAVTDAVGLETRAVYDYRVMQPREVTDVNGNRTVFGFTPLGLLDTTWVSGKAETAEGDQARPSIRMHYGFLAFEESVADARQPVYVRTVRQIHHDTEADVAAAELDDTIETIEYSDGFGRLLQTRTQGEDIRFGDAHFGGGEAVLPVLQADGAGNDLVGIPAAAGAPHVVVSGWQTYDNKGLVVEKYEPFFSTGWDYATPQEAQLGRKATLFYDPRGQAIRTLNPDGSEQRVIYGVPPDLDDPIHFEPTPWETHTYDANDNAGRTHPDTAGIYRHHWNTPASGRLDALGRIVEAVQRTRADSATGEPLAPLETHRTRTTYDLQGNVLSLIDALGRVAFTCRYDLVKRPLHTLGIDAGECWTVPDAASRPLQQWDGKGARVLHEYDVLNRPVRLWAGDGQGQPLTLRQQLVYGDGGDAQQPAAERAAGRAANSLGKPMRHFDDAGLAAIERYDFKGNVLEKSRRVIGDDALLAVSGGAANPIEPFVVDWNPPPGTNAEQHAANLLEPARHQTSLTYDALDRLRTLRYPAAVDGIRRELRPHYNRSGALEQVLLDGAIHVERIAYNARGQRLFIAYGNRVMTRHAYDPDTFRLTRMRIERFQPTGDAGYHPTGQPLQDFAYRYDLAGNVLRIDEHVPGCGYADHPDELVRRFAYDPLYRLTYADGRQDDAIANPRPWADLRRAGYNSTNHGTANQDGAPTLTSGYWERYAYDPAGNLLSLVHGSSDQTPDWTRHFGMGGLSPQQWQQAWPAHHAAYDWPTPPGNQLTHVGDDQPGAPQTHGFDANGNLERENTERHFQWDYADRLKSFRIQPETGPASVHAQYLYDASGQRVKKLVRRGANRHSVTIYIDGLFELHRRVRPNETLANNTLHVMDNQSRIAMRRVGAAFPGDGAPQAAVKYHLGDHLGSSHLVIGGAEVDGNDFINREEYFPYGETSFGSFGRKRYRYTGKERDEESGLNYHGARYYAAWLGRWVSCDPLGATNLYSACGNNPINRIDPHGTSERPPNVDAPESMVRQRQEEAIIRNPSLFFPSAEETARRKLLDNVLVMGPLGTMKESTYKKRQEAVRNDALGSGGRGFILGAMLFDIARNHTDDPALWLAADEMGNALMGMAGTLSPQRGAASSQVLRNMPGRLIVRAPDAPIPQRPPFLSVVEIKPDNPSAVKKGWAQASDRVKYIGKASSERGNMGLATYSLKTGKVILEVKESGGYQNVLYRKEIGQLTPEQLSICGGDLTECGNRVEPIIRDMITHATGQTPTEKNSPSANGPDWLPRQPPLPGIR